MFLAIHAARGIDLEHVGASGRLAQDAEASPARPIAPGVFVVLGVCLGANDRAELNHLKRVVPVAPVLFVAPTDVDCLADVDALAIKHERVKVAFALFVFL